ncbi:hypothetical protein [Flavobacterium ustbae]|uniref:hypothetical protein n=1 Tax=Flavobacterium ustbae TaxID=2488790 RepID=UPI000F7793CA|nr:hypothetical protein [Flavobacterium ustbae]
MIWDSCRELFSEYIKRGVLFFLFFIFLSGLKSFAQNKSTIQDSKFYKVISFDEKIAFGNFESSTLWIITDLKDNSATTLQANEINNYVFQEPGEYVVTFRENKKHTGECDHPLLPEKMHIKVEAVKLSFDFSKIKFSQNLQKGTNYSDLIISVPVKIATRNSFIKKLPAPAMSISGIGVELTAKALENEIFVNNPTQILKYKLSGLIAKETYLMFDFFDFNNQAQTYNLPQLIK